MAGKDLPYTNLASNALEQAQVGHAMLGMWKPNIQWFVDPKPYLNPNPCMKTLEFGGGGSAARQPRLQRCRAGAGEPLVTWTSNSAVQTRPKSRNCTRISPVTTSSSGTCIGYMDVMWEPGPLHWASSEPQPAKHGSKMEAAAASAARLRPSCEPHSVTELCQLSYCAVRRGRGDEGLPDAGRVGAPHLAALRADHRPGDCSRQCK